MKPFLIYLVKVLSAPVCCSLACMTIKDGKEAVSSDALVVVNKGMRVLFGSKVKMRFQTALC